MGHICSSEDPHGSIEPQGHSDSTSTTIPIARLGNCGIFHCASVLGLLLSAVPKLGCGSIPLDAVGLALDVKLGLF